MIPFVLSLHPIAVLALNLARRGRSLGRSLGRSVNLPSLQHPSAIILFAQQTLGRRFTHPGAWRLLTP